MEYQREKEFERNMAQYGDEQEAIKQLEAKAKQFMALGMGRNSSALTKQGKTLWERAQRMRRLISAKKSLTILSLKLSVHPLRSKCLRSSKRIWKATPEP